jgi:ketosteroid isomerase-like protein
MSTHANLETIQNFNAAFNRHDVDAIMALMTEDCRFENTSPPPDGACYQGQQTVRAFWERFFQEAPGAVFEWEEVFACEERGIVCWTYRWAEDRPDKPGHIRGVDVLRVRDGKIAEKFSYVKG